MIPPIHSPWEPELWQAELSEAVRDPEALLRALDLPVPTPAINPTLIAGTTPGKPSNDFATLVPPGFIKRMQKGNPHDPLLLQVLADPIEDVAQPQDYSGDPLEETGPSTIRTPGLVQKYDGRALLIATPGCAVHCRYCFRRHFPYADHRPKHMIAALEHIAQDTTLSEIILSGGDPLLLGEEALGELFQQLNALPHIKRIRLHTRLPIVIPERVTANLLGILTHSRAKVAMVVHCNHAQELNHATARAFALIKQACQTLLNQSVLLKGVNDSASEQINLAEKLFEQGVLPYYLHMPDEVIGTAHFDVNWQNAQSIYQTMQSKLPGYLVPRLVKEEAGKAHKTLLPNA